MSDYQHLLEKARSLGEAIANHERVRAYLAARRAVQTDAEAGTLLRDYQAQAERMRTLSAEQKPIEVADKRALAELEGKMASSAALKQLMRAQADYIELMNHINEAMEAPIMKVTQPEQPK